ncbi:hypothetical protein RHGRI_000708 [Rhododendron griersonianum]|uniref:DUF4283 domain-containing protein n=1 Tax=Rhododendron griersonianum TaxID=479676 RepID=A0AAV6LIR1_9ERIC|nr:hypothetical protein RHGRI_000708 [Rhododendron griersonianum]
MKFQYFPPTVEGERITVSPPSAVELQGALKWKDCLVGHFVDKNIPFLAVRSVAFKKWADYGLVDVLSNEKGFYFFQFGSTDALDLLTASGKTVTIAIKYPWQPVKCGSCKVFGHSDCSQKVVHAPERVIDPTKAAPKGQVWVVKSGGGDSISNPLEVSEPAVIVPASSIKELPRSNQFDALQLMDKEDTSGTVVVSKAAEVHLDSGKVMHKESLGAASIRTDPSSSKVMDEPHYGTLPDVLGEGMEDPYALFQVLTSMDMVDTNKPKERKNPGAAKRGRKPKNQ